MKTVLERPASKLLLAATCAALVASGAQALTDEEIFRLVELDFTSPGSRALGMGGTSIASAFDATAVLANPAGLHVVENPVINVDFRTRDADTRILGATLGSLEIDPATGDRELPYLDLTSVSKDDRSIEESFLGEAFRLSPRFTAALAFRSLLSQERTLTEGDQTTGARFAFDSFPNTVVDGMVEAYAVETVVQGASDTDLKQLSAALTFEPSPEFSVGLTLSYARLDLEMATRTRVVDPIQLLSDPGHPRLPGTPSTDMYVTAIDDSDGDVSYTLGIHWHPDTLFAAGRSPLHFGATLHKGAGFDLVETASLNGVADPTFTNRIVEPDRFGVGASYRPDEHWTLTLEYERIEYSDMLEGFRSGVNYLTSERVAEGGFSTDPDASVEFTVDDGSLPRAGAEYARSLPSGLSYAIRAGYYRLPDGRIRMSRFNSTDPDINSTYLQAFSGAGAEDRFTVGAGMQRGRYSAGLAGDFGDNGTTVVASVGFVLGHQAASPAPPSGGFR